MEVSEVLDHVDIYDYVSQYCDLELKPDGEYWGLSPLKEENTPSFSVNRDKQRYYDFSSGNGGNVLDFVCQYNRCGFGRGLDILKQYAHINEDTGESETKRLLASSIAKQYRQKPKAQKVSKAQTLAPDYMDRYVRDEGRLLIWEGEGISMESMDKFLVRYDPFSNRLVFPIRNPNGDIINVSGRTLDPKYKEKKLRKYTYFFNMGTLDTIYGLWENREEILKQGEIVLFEGAKSVMLADTWGIRNTGAILTSHLNQGQFLLLVKLGVRVVFALDAEVDIRQDKTIRKLLPYVPVEWVQNRDGLLKEKEAPVDQGREVFEMLYNERRWL